MLVTSGVPGPNCEPDTALSLLIFYMCGSFGFTKQNSCFLKRIGNPPYQRQEVTITSFDGINVATRYNIIVPTCQGYFTKLEEKDIVKEYLEPKEFPEKGEVS